jgi:hypothetical protein
MEVAGWRISAGDEEDNDMAAKMGVVEVGQGLERLI